MKEDLKNVSVEELKNGYKNYLDQCNYAENTKSTKLTDAFYLSRNTDIDLIQFLLSDDFEKEAKLMLYNTLLKHSNTSNIQRDVNGYFSHLNFLRKFAFNCDITQYITNPDDSLTKESTASPQSNIADIANMLSRIEYYHNSVNLNNTRYNSWIHCYKAFKNHRGNPEKEEYLCLQLGFFLASWGMLRNSGLLNYDYYVHKPFIKAISDKKYDALYNDDCEDIELIFNAVSEIHNCYPENITKTDTLVTKILLGVFGCIPAYDRYFVDGIRKNKVATGTFTKKSLNQLFAFYNMHPEFENLRQKISSPDIKYPKMKIMDMCFWQIGVDIKNANK